MKKSLSILLTLLFTFSLLSITVCNVSAEVDTQGVEFVLSEDKSRYIVSSFNGASPNVVIPEAFNGLPVSEIKSFAFQSSDSLKSVSLPKSIVSVGSNPFFACTSLKAISVDKNNKNFHSDNNCLIDTKNKKLISACNESVIPDDGSVIDLGRYAFGGLTAISHLTLPDSIKAIGNNTFNKCTNLESITLPNGLLSISDSAFSKCEKLENFEIPKDTMVGDNAFDGCEKITFTIYDGCKYFGSNGNPYQLLYTADDKSKKNYTIHPDTIQIAGSAFSGCTSLEHIDIPDSVKHMENDVFDGCVKLTQVSVPEHAVLGYNVFNGCTALKYTTYKGGIYYGNEENPYQILHGIEDTSLKSHTVHPDTKQIGAFAFYDCPNLTTVDIPASVITVGESLFYKSPKMSTVYFGNQEQLEGFRDGWRTYCEADIIVKNNSNHNNESSIAESSIANSSIVDSSVVDSSVVDSSVVDSSTENNNNDSINPEADKNSYVSIETEGDQSEVVQESDASINLPFVIIGLILIIMGAVVLTLCITSATKNKQNR